MISCGLSGHFRLEVRNAETHQITKVRDFENLITDSGLDSYGYAYNSNLNRCMVGTGSTPVSQYDTSLGAQYAYVDGVAENTEIAPVAPNWISAARNRYRFPVGVATGNVAEVGVGGSASPYPFWSRALVVNEQGQQSPISVLSNEYLDVIYTLRLHPNLNDIPFSFTLGGVTYSGTARPAYIQDSRNTAENGAGVTGLVTPNSGIEIVECYNSGTLGTILQGIQNWTEHAVIPFNTPFETQDYVRGSFRRDFKHTLTLDSANMTGGVKAMLIQPRPIGNYGTIGRQFAMKTQIVFNTPIPKDNTNSIIFTLRVQWGRWIGS